MKAVNKLQKYIFINYFFSIENIDMFELFYLNDVLCIKPFLKLPDVLIFIKMIRFD